MTTSTTPTLITVNCSPDSSTTDGEGVEAGADVDELVASVGVGDGVATALSVGVGVSVDGGDVGSDGGDAVPDGEAESDGEGETTKEPRPVIAEPEEKAHVTPPSMMPPARP